MPSSPLPVIPAGESFAAEADRVAAAGASFVSNAGESGQLVLIKGGTVLSMDDTVGDHAVGDVLTQR